jgi:hypothetical protein
MNYKRIYYRCCFVLYLFFIGTARENGEWYGYLHRDATIAQTAKGNLFKGPFHLRGQECIMQRLAAHLMK